MRVEVAMMSSWTSCVPALKYYPQIVISENTAMICIASQVQQWPLRILPPEYVDRRETKPLSRLASFV
ncbi:hypothetical protein BGZ63DRAFT_396229 [Mariannaea sp. PMI_226]|nr:hypothetical protein BGZ63DRAFT_396229 [Mariannaea sp. PMI_226]